MTTPARSSRCSATSRGPGCAPRSSSPTSTPRPRSPRTSNPIQVWDPVNPANNVARTYTEADRQRLVKTATTALEEITWAAQAPTKGDANDAWRTVLGPGFEGA